MMPYAQDVIQFFAQDQEAQKRVHLQAKDMGPVKERMDQSAERILAERANEVTKTGKVPPTLLFIP